MVVTMGEELRVGRWEVSLCGYRPTWLKIGFLWFYKSSKFKRAIVLWLVNSGSGFLVFEFCPSGLVISVNETLSQSWSRAKHFYLGDFCLWVKTNRTSSFKHHRIFISVNSYNMRKFCLFHHHHHSANCIIRSAAYFSMFKL